MATKVAVLLGFSLWGLQPPRVRSQLGVGLSSFLPNRGLARMWPDGEEGAGPGEEAGWGGASVQAEAELACPANHSVLLGVCIKNGANPNPGQG